MAVAWGTFRLIELLARGVHAPATASLPCRPHRVDVNRAPVAELATLPGVGRTRAEAIVVDRVRRGPFRTVAELERVPGLGAGAVERVRPFARCGG